MSASTRPETRLGKGGAEMVGDQGVSIATEAMQSGEFDPILLAVMSNRIDGVCRQMTNTLLRSGRSSVLALARDFSCSVVTSGNQLLAAAEGLPVHVIGSEFLCEAMTELH